MKCQTFIFVIARAWCDWNFQHLPLSFMPEEIKKKKEEKENHAFASVGRHMKAKMFLLNGYCLNFPLLFFMYRHGLIV